MASSYFDIGSVKAQLASFERDVIACEQYYNSVGPDTMQRRENFRQQRQRAQAACDKLKVLLELNVRSPSDQNEKNRLVAQSQDLCTRFSNVQRRTIDFDEEAISKIRRSLNDGNKDDIVLGNNVILKSVDVTQEMMREINDDLERTTESMRALEAIAREMNEITANQGRNFDSAENNAQGGDTEVRVGVGEQEEASTLACQGRKLIIVIIVIVSICILALALGIGLGVGLKKKT